MDKSKKSADLDTGSSKTGAPQLTDSDLDKVTGGFIGSYIKVPDKPLDIKGESGDSSHGDKIETLS